MYCVYLNSRKSGWTPSQLPIASEGTAGLTSHLSSLQEDAALTGDSVMTGTACKAAELLTLVGLLVKKINGQLWILQI